VWRARIDTRLFYEIPYFTPNSEGAVEVVRLIIRTRSGEERVVQAPQDRTLMEVIRENGFEDLLALCGGCCSCATCHVYVDPAHVARLPAMSADEDELLAGSDVRQPTSRLSCQVRVTGALDGLRVTIAPSG
jgi:2Fe-2S ferredoxin